MSSSSAGNGAGADGGNGTAARQHQKRTRVLLSCAPCRYSKLKCDRATPCGQCLKKGKPEACQYAPRPEKHKPAKTMAARLKRLEGMVRGMIDTPPVAEDKKVTPAQQGVQQGTSAGGYVVEGGRAGAGTNYVGGTHFMAMLEDIEDLKNYFDDSDEGVDENHDTWENMSPQDLIMLSRGVPRDKDELLALLPERSICDRIMNRYLNSNSPSRHIIHIPTFTKEYNSFWKNPNETSLHWIALLFMVLCLGIFFSSFNAPHELEMDSDIPAMDRVKQYRGAAGWALIWGKYSQPGFHTLQAFLLYVESDFVCNRVSQMNCYLLCSVLIRLMLKMGLHRDPSKLPNITPYYGEMRRRLWNLAVQIDLLVAFHLGLPCMIAGIESDTALPRNLVDSDFDEDSKELPPARPNSDYTTLTYPIYKASVARVFGLVARQAHALIVPSYAEIMKVDAKIEETWQSVPSFMKLKPLEESVTDPPMQVIQRFGLESLYQKSRCVLHRRFLCETVPKREHEYSRRVCLEAAIALLDCQYSMTEACKPGGLLSQHCWFLASLAVNDFLLADAVVALILQNKNDPEIGSNYNWMIQRTPLPPKDELLQLLKRSYGIWCEMAVMMPDFKRPAWVVRTMLVNIQKQLGIKDADIVETPGRDYSFPLTGSSDGTASMAGLQLDGSDPSTAPSSYGPTTQDFAGLGMTDPTLMSIVDSMQDQDALDTSWMIQDGYDWNQFDAMTRGPGDAIQPMPQISQPAQIDGNPIGDFTASNWWNMAPDR
ncbi:fungal-specific transcription factor domain-containing protein [Whalleya microplaca]|nr:fungal-specific transcription factor domain-containing protein [Whalleya microplaca]